MTRPKKPKPSTTRTIRGDNPNSIQVMVRLSPELLERLDAYVRTKNHNNIGPRWTRCAAVRQIITELLPTPSDSPTE